MLVKLGFVLGSVALLSVFHNSQGCAPDFSKAPNNYTIHLYTDRSWNDDLEDCAKKPTQILALRVQTALSNYIQLGVVGSSSYMFKKDIPEYGVEKFEKNSTTNKINVNLGISCHYPVATVDKFLKDLLKAHPQYTYPDLDPSKNITINLDPDFEIFEEDKLPKFCATI